jgi:hypothetical protein
MAMLTTEYMDIHAVTDYVQAGAGVAGILNAAKLILATNAFTPTKLRVVADLTQPSYGGYAPVTVTWAAAARDQAGDIVTLSQLFPIQQTGGPVVVTIYGYGLTDSAGTNLLLSELFTVPITLVDDLTYFGLQVPFSPPVPEGKSAIISS